MGSIRVIKRVVLDEQRESTGTDRHVIDGVEMARPAILEIVRCGQDSGYSVYYCDRQGHPMTDTHHDSLDDALHQAETEFGVKADDWGDVDEVTVFADSDSVKAALIARQLVRETDPWELRLEKVGRSPVRLMAVLIRHLDLPVEVAKDVIFEAPLVVRTYGSEKEGLELMAQIEAVGAMGSLEERKAQS